MRCEITMRSDGDISIHAPRVGCDSAVVSHIASVPVFQSTHPVWGATRAVEVAQWYKNLFQSTHPVWGATGPPEQLLEQQPFQSTHPVWGATCFRSVGSLPVWISIHAPRVGCDRTPAVTRPPPRYFNPRTPCGVRPGALTHPTQWAWYFNPRTPCGVRPTLWCRFAWP